ncbi:DUF975 family protein [uncultured Eubacterium sp.]|uniref:DUF975 family protein n=1 Tax=uncultured Eubacterium sp. TaxID=165185 RepID=UPI0025F89B08|nr:DUF975 family protein [uncultured Eubacterium sp.]
MKSFADLKANARSALLGRYSVLIGAGILAWLISTLIEIPFSRMLQEGIYYTRIIRIIWAYTGMLFVSLIGSLFNIGITYMHMQSARDTRPQFSDLLYPFRNRPDKFIGCEFILVLISFVCTLPGTAVTVIAALQSDTITSIRISSPLIIGLILLAIGLIVQIILGFAFSQAVYLLIDHPDYRVMEALRGSFHLMRGRKMRYFLLQLSFIGWGLLGCLTLGIGFLWIIPYMLQTNTQFYLNLKELG